ncbi:MAG: EscU/YscU/HrcU family type III secretion system export apparatus switch protein [Leptospira sp.]|nr:EscU/YscU/HrcU family type III secretion system export apparatus switch protein [Leptospira sp.]
MARLKSKATALRFLPSRDNAPKVVATGEGSLALKIEQLAKENGIEVIRDPHLADTLGRLTVGAEIPEELYKVVSVLFRYLWDRDPSRKEM